jgi:prevent-host-death family protein
MKSASATRIAARFNDYLKASREQPVLITRNGKPVAVLLGVQNKAEAEELAVDRSRKSARAVGFLTISFGGRSSNRDTPSGPLHRGGSEGRWRRRFRARRAPRCWRQSG